MIGFGENNEELGRVSPGLVSCEEQIISDDNDLRSNSLIIRLITETGIKLKIQFDNYLMHMTRDESYTMGDEYEIRKGMWLIKFEKSRFLDLNDSDTVITTNNLFDTPGQRSHYGIYTWDYLIDVITYNAPMITQE